MIFKCKHKFTDLVVSKESTETPHEDYPNDFNIVTYHLFCSRCGSRLDLEHAKLVKTVPEFLKTI